MADAIDTLMSEHRIIEKVLAAFELASDRELSLSFYERALDFLAAFADACHHGKEENGLFPMLERHGIARELGPIGIMCDEHAEGRGHVRRMRDLLRAGDRKGLRRESLAYAALLRRHIAKEEEVLFAMARDALGPEEVRQLGLQFDAVDGALRPRERYGAVADGLLAEADSA